MRKAYTFFGFAGGYFFSRPVVVPKDEPVQR